MKKIINNISGALLCLFLIVNISCTNKKKENTQVKTSAEILQEVNLVTAIGKVTSEKGSAIISSKKSGEIKYILVNEGDQVKAGDHLIIISNPLNQVDQDLVAVKLNTLKEQQKVTQRDIEREQIELNYLKEQFLTSKNLYDQQAETKSNFLNDQTKYLQQQQKVNALLAQGKINESQIQEQGLEIEKTKILLTDYIIAASSSGIVTNLEAKLGQNVNTSESLGEISDTADLIIEAEVDELFADKIKLGQKVNFNNLNTKQYIGEGEVIYTSPILSNKSILFESANEAEDRRVRKVKIKPTKTSSTLLINAKLECQIKMN